MPSKAIESQRGFRTRTAQHEMAHAVAEVFDHGGRLAVEAPTGTGKSLAYLLPALGRASRPGQPVIVATATKALQGQLREEAARLQSEGLLTAPFRQIQGVGNYVCARELEDALSDRESSGLAIAIALRAIAASPSGTWDDVTDDVIRNRDTRYARTRARLRTNAGGCDRVKCSRAKICPLMQQIRGLEKSPGVVSVNHALIASWVRIQANGGKAPGDVLAESRADLVFDEAHALEDSLTAAWTERVDALELQILVNSLSPRSRLMKVVALECRHERERGHPERWNKWRTSARARRRTRSRRSPPTSTSTPASQIPRCSAAASSTIDPSSEVSGKLRRPCATG